DRQGAAKKPFGTIDAAWKNSDSVYTGPGSAGIRGVHPFPRDDRAPYRSDRRRRTRRPAGDDRIEGFACEGGDRIGRYVGRDRTRNDRAGGAGDAQNPGLAAADLLSRVHVSVRKDCAKFFHDQGTLTT